MCADKKVVVRATASPGCRARIDDEVTFLRFVVAAGMAACGPIEPGVAASDDGDTVIVVSRWAEGEAPVYNDWIWANDVALVHCHRVS